MKKYIKWIFLKGLSFFGFLQFLQFFESNLKNVPILNNKLGFEIILSIVSFILASIWYVINKICPYKFSNANKKVNLRVEYGDIFCKKYFSGNENTRIVIATAKDLIVKYKDDDGNSIIDEDSTYVQFLKKQNITCDDTLGHQRDSEDTFVTYKNYILMKLAEYDEDYNVHIKLSEYVSLIVELCEYIDEHVKGEKIVLPVIGGKISLKGVSGMDRLVLIESIFRTYPFDKKIDITIVVRNTERLENNYDLSTLKRK